MASKNIKNYYIVAQNDGFPATKPKDTEYCDLTDKESKRPVRKKIQ